MTKVSKAVPRRQITVQYEVQPVSQEQAPQLPRDTQPKHARTAGQRRGWRKTANVS